MLSTMKYGLLNALLMISMNCNNCGSDEVERVIKAAVCYYYKTRRIKELIKYLTFSYIILKNGQTYYKNLAVFSRQDF